MCVSRMEMRWRALSSFPSPHRVSGDGAHRACSQQVNGTPYPADTSFVAMSASINPYEEARLYTSNAEREQWESMATLFSIIVSLDALERAYVRESISEAQYAPACTRLLGQFKTVSKLVMSADASAGSSSSTAGVPVIRDADDFMSRFKVGRNMAKGSGRAGGREMDTCWLGRLLTCCEYDHCHNNWMACRRQMNHAGAAHRLRVGVPATVEHASAATGSASSSAERSKWVAETTQGFITFMDALKLKLRAKDQLHPLLSDLMSSYSRFSDNSSASGQEGAGQGRARVLHWYVYFATSGSNNKDQKLTPQQFMFTPPRPPRSRLITLNQMKASDEIDEEQARQVSLQGCRIGEALRRYGATLSDATALARLSLPLADAIRCRGRVQRLVPLAPGFMT